MTLLMLMSYKNVGKYIIHGHLSNFVISANKSNIHKLLIFTICSSCSPLNTEKKCAAVERCRSRHENENRCLVDTRLPNS